MRKHGNKSLGRKGAALAQILLLLVSLAQNGCGFDPITAISAAATAGKVSGDVKASVETLVTGLKELVPIMDKAAQDALKTADAVLAHQIQEVSAAVHEQIDAINAALNGTIKNIDTMLAARIRQLHEFVKDFVRDLNGVIQGTIRSLTYSADTLIQRLENSAINVLDAAGLNVIRILEEGGQIVAVVTSKILHTVMVVGAVLLMVLTLVFGLLFYRKWRGHWVPATGLMAVMVAFSFAVVFMPPDAEAKLFGAQTPLGSVQSKCSAHSAAATGFLASIRVPIQPANVPEAVEHLGRMLECEATGWPTRIRQEAAALAFSLQQALGLAPSCTSNHQCRAGQHCELSVGLCSSRCKDDAMCGAGQVCHHDLGGVCAPACGTDAACEAWVPGECGTCSNHHCAPAQCQATPATPWKPGRPILVGGHMNRIPFDKLCANSQSCLRDPRVEPRLLGGLLVGPTH